MARLWNAERSLHVDLTAVPAEGWQRHQYWPDTGLPFLPTSPSLPSYETALLYPGTCLFEGTNLSEGRGTAVPFRALGAPWLAGQAVCDAFNSRSLPGVAARNVNFTPDVGKHAGSRCQGIMLHVTDRDAFRPVATGLHLLATIIHHHPNDFQWLPYSTAANAPGYGHFDRLIGRLDIRERLSDGQGTADTIAGWTYAEDWADRVNPWLLYT
jgi:uncharacterized protein YbbC (DUF1343 family)